jgi:hypothetical protein
MHGCTRVIQKFPDWLPERELQMVQLCATRCSCIAIFWVSLVSFAAITLCVASQRVFVIVVYFFMDSVRKLLDTPSYVRVFPAFLCRCRPCDGSLPAQDVLPKFLKELIVSEDNCEQEQARGPNPWKEKQCYNLTRWSVVVMFIKIYTGKVGPISGW